MASDDPKPNEPKIDFGTGQPFYDSFARTPTTGPAQTGKASDARPPEPPSGGRGTSSVGNEPRTEPPMDGGPALPGIWCSDCRQVMHTQYWAMNDRPVCAKCAAPYRAKIGYGTGTAAFMRSLRYGAAVGAVGAIACALVFLIFGFSRVLLFAAIGYGIGKAVGKGNGNFGGRRYQLLAVALTWLAVAFAYMPSALAGLRVSGTIGGALEATAIGTYVVAAKAKGRNKEMEQIKEILTNRKPGNDTTFDNFGNVVTVVKHDSAGGDSSVVVVDSTSLAALATDRPRPKPPGIPVLLVFTFIFIVILPAMAPLALFPYSMYGAGIALLSLLFGLYKAWTIAEGGPNLKVMGPYRVGAGPIKPTV